VVLSALRFNPDAILFATDPLLRNNAFVYAAVVAFPQVLKYREYLKRKNVVLPRQVILDSVDSI